MTTACRILFISHSHPALQNGGAEIAAFNLYEAFNQAEHSEAWFLACGHTSHDAHLGSCIAQPFSEREYLYASTQFDWFKFANRDANFPHQFESLLQELQPGIVHFHHYLNIGVEAFEIVRRTLPQARIILTLHEYLAICHHHGQMTKSDRSGLCRESGFSACHACFPQHSAADFFLRKTYIRTFFDKVDQFIAPSAFLAARYAAWGVPESRIHIIENLLRTPDRLRIPEKPRTDPMLRIGFFGQISWLKGCNVLLDAAAILADNHVTNIVFDIHGDDRGQPPAFQNEFRERLGKASSNVVYHGPYENDTVDRLMEGVDAVLVPSVWWENSPLVIQEARRNRKPVLCSDIGGMAEKVRDGKDGFHFRSGDALSLVALLQRLVDERTLLQNLQDTMAQPDASANIMARHRHVYSGSGPCPAI